MDRFPKAPPFAVGTRIRYIGTRTCYADLSLSQMTFGPGMEFEITEVREGKRGTLRHLRDADGPMYYDDTGEPIRDETRDGYSCYTTPSGLRSLVDASTAHEWEVVR